MRLHDLKSPKGARHRKKIVGRGRGTGWGKTSGRGENGQGSREGRGILRNLEGGQMPLIRRLPKVGFRSHRPVLNQVVKVGSLEQFDKDTVINAELLKSKGLISSIHKPFKILGTGEITKPLVIQTESISKSAQEKVVKAGGKIELIQKNVPVKKEKQAKKEEKPAAEDPESK